MTNARVVIAATAAGSSCSVSVCGEFSKWRFIFKQALGTWLRPDATTAAPGTAKIIVFLALEKQLCELVSTMIANKFTGRHSLISG
jgi:hypothetical protein